MMPSQNNKISMREHFPVHQIFYGGEPDAWWMDGRHLFSSPNLYAGLLCLHPTLWNHHPYLGPDIFPSVPLKIRSDARERVGVLWRCNQSPASQHRGGLMFCSMHESFFPHVELACAGSQECVYMCVGGGLTICWLCGLALLSTTICMLMSRGQTARPVLRRE